MADFNITVGIDTVASLEPMKQDISSIISSLNNKPPKIKVDLDIDSATLKSVREQVSQISTMSASGNRVTSAGVADVQGIRKTASAWRALTKAMNQAAEAAKNADGVVNRSASQASAQPVKQAEKIKKLTLESKEYYAALKQIDTLLAQVTNSQNKWTSAKTGKTSSEYNSLGTYADTLRQLRTEIISLAGSESKAGMSQDDFTRRMGAARSGVTSATTTIKNAGEATKAWGDRVGTLSAKFGTWLTISQVIMAGVRSVKQMAANTIELDTAMTELKKVTDETSSVYDTFLNKASSRSKNLGTSLTDIVSASADFARLGYKIEDAEKLADAAVVYKNVGDGIEDIGDASESIISTMQAFGIEADNVMNIVDKFNEVGNNYAISSKGVGDALLRSASAMKAANNTIDETIALATAANTVVQDPDKVGTSLKTLSMYLRAAKTEAEEAGESTEGMANSISELRSELLSLTGNKVDIQSDENTFKSTYQIMKELSAVWSELTDISQANILELIGGKRNSNVVAAMLENFSVADKALETSANAANSAMEENEKYLESVEGRLQKFKATFQELSNTVVNGDFLKGLVSSGTNLLTVLNDLVSGFGGLGDVITLVGLAIAAMRMDRTLKTVDSIYKSIKNLGGLKTTISKIRAAEFEAFTGRDGQGFWGALGQQFNTSAFTAKATAAALGITLVTTALDMALGAHKEYLEGIKDAGNKITEEWNNFSQSYQSNIEKLSSYQTEFPALAAGVDEEGKNVSLAADQYERYNQIVSDVSAMNSELVTKYGMEAAVISNKNDLLKESIELQKQAYAKQLGDTFSDANMLKQMRGLSADLELTSNEAYGVDSVGSFIGAIGQSLMHGLDEFQMNAANQVSEKQEEITNSLRETLQLIPQLSDEYNNLGNTSKNFITDLINQIHYTDDLQSSILNIRDQIVQVTDAFADNSSSFNMLNRAKELNQSFDEGQLSVKEYTSSMAKLSAEQSNAVSNIAKIISENQNLAKAIGVWDTDLNGVIDTHEVEVFISPKLKTDTQDVFSNLQELLDDSLKNAGKETNIDLSSIFGSLNKSQINDISAMLAKAFPDDMDKQGKAIGALAQSFEKFDEISGGGLSKILDDLDRSNPASIERYNTEIKSFFDTIKNSDGIGEEFSASIRVLEDVLGSATAELENFETTYSKFISLAENGDITQGETAVGKAIEVIKNGMEEGRVSSSLFNESLNILFGNNRPKDLNGALEILESLFATGEDSVDKFYEALKKFTEGGAFDLQKLRGELGLSDAAFNALKDKMRESGLLFANTEDMNRIGDGLGIANDKVYQFEQQAGDLVEQFKAGSISAEEYNSKVDELAESYGVASEAAEVFKRNMDIAGGGEFRVADGDFKGNMTAFLGIGGEVANGIEQTIAEAQNGLTLDNIINIDGTIDSIRSQLEATGDYTQQEIEAMLGKLRSRIYEVRLNTAISAEGAIQSITVDTPEGRKDISSETLQGILKDSFDAETGTIDMGKVEASISALDVVTKDGADPTAIMEQLGFAKGENGEWTLGDGSVGFAKVAMELSTDAASANLNDLVSSAQALEDKLAELNSTAVNLNIEHWQLAESEAQAQSLLNKLSELPDEKEIRIKITQEGTIPNTNGQASSVTSTGGTAAKQENGGQRRAFGGRAKNGEYLLNDGTGSNAGKELIIRKDGTYGYMDSKDGLPALANLKDGDIVLSATDTRKVQTARYVNLGSRLAGGTTGYLPSSTGNTSSSGDSSSSSSRSNSSKSAKDSEETAKNAEKIAEKIEEANEKLAEIARKEHLQKLKKTIQDVEDELDNLNAKIEIFSGILDLTSDIDYAGRTDAYTNMLSLATEKASMLYSEFDRLKNIMPQSADEAQALSDRMDSLAEDIMSNAKSIREYATLLDMVRVEAVKNQIEGIDDQLSNSERVLERSRNALTEHTLLGRNGAFSTSFLIPSLNDDVVEQKRKENEKLIELEEWLQSEVFKIKQRYTEMSHEEAMEDFAKQREEAEKTIEDTKDSSKSSSSSSRSSSSSVSAQAQTAASTTPSAHQTGAFVLTDVTDYDSLVNNMKNILAAKISSMVAEFTNNEWKQIVNAHPLTAFTLDEESWKKLQDSIGNILASIGGNGGQQALTVQGIAPSDVVQDSLNALTANMLNTEDDSWTAMSDSLLLYIQQTYGLMEADWEALCINYPLIAAALKLTGENSWAARDMQLNGTNGIVMTMMNNASTIVGNTILPAARYDVASYQQLGRSMGQTVADSLRSVLGEVEIRVQTTPIVSSTTSLPGNSSSNPQGIQTSGSGGALVATAQKYLGIPYVWGGTSPKGFDCSGLMQYVYQENGININRVADDQWHGAGLKITSMESLRPGDMVFFGESGSDYASHVGMYVGNGRMIHAPHTGTTIQYTDIFNSNYYRGHFLGGKRLVAYASGTDGAVGGKALVGEKGRELAILPNGQSVLLGKNGAEIVDIPKGTQIFPNEDTETVLKYTGDKIDGRTIPKYAGGTIDPMEIAAYIKKKYPEITNAGIAAILGNIEQESSFNPKNKTVEAYGGGSSAQIARWGLFQLDDTRISNWSSIVNNGTWQQQVDTALAEGRYLNSGMGSLSKYNVWANVLTNPNMSAAEAARQFDKLFERSDGNSREKRAANAEKYLSQIENALDSNGVGDLTAAIQVNTGTVEDNTTATKSQEKTISDRINELTKAPSSYSKEFLDSYMSYVDQRKTMLAVASEARKNKEFGEADAIDDSLLMRDIEETFAMQLNLYTESAKAYQEQYENLQALYYEAVEQGSDESVLSEIITAMSEVSAKIDEVSEKWQSAVEDMGESFSTIITRITSEFVEAITRAERNIANLEHMLNVTKSPDLRTNIYRSMDWERDKMIRNTKAIMDAAQQTAEYQRGERTDYLNLNSGTLRDYAAREGQLVRSYYASNLESFGDYESWFNSNGTINTQKLTESIADFDDDLKQRATDFAKFLSAYKVVWANDAAQQFDDIVAQYGIDQVQSWFDGNGEITQAAWDMVENAEDESFKNRLVAFLSYQSALKKIYYENQGDYLENIEEQYGIWQNIVDEASNALGNIRGLYSSLKDAAEEYSKTGFISVDSFEAIAEYGTEYMAFLRDENGQLVINKDTIEKVIAARTEQLGVTTALNYVEQLRLALESDNTTELEHLLNATKATAATTWDLVNANLEMLNLAPEQKLLAKQRIQDLRSLAAAASDGVLAGFDDKLSAYDEQKSAIEDILDLVMSLIQYEKDKEVEALNDQIDRYREIVNLKKESLAVAKEEDEHNKSVADKVKEIAEIQSKINQLSLDDSREAQAEKKSLETDLADLQEELADYQADYAYDKTNEMLDKSLEAYEKEKNDEIEAVQESVSSTEKVYQLAIERLKGDWNTLYADILQWNYDAGSSIESDIVERWKLATDAVKEYGSYLEAYAHLENGTWNSGYTEFTHSSSSGSDGEFVIGNHTPVANSNSYSGSNINQLLTQLRGNATEWWTTTSSNRRSALESENARLVTQAEQILGEHITPSNGTWYRENGEPLFEINKNEVARQIVSLMKQNSAQWANAYDMEKLALEDENNKFANRLSELLGQRVVKDEDGVWWIGNSRLYDKYHSGGIVGRNSSLKDNEVMAVLEKGEVVLDDNKKDALYEYIDLSTYMLERFGKVFDNTGTLVSKLKSGSDFDNLLKDITNNAYNIKGQPASYNIESLEVSAPVQVVEKLDAEEIKRHSRMIGEISADFIHEGFTKRAIKATAGRF